jgi:2-dehydro-3-deoxygluconokinase
MAAKGLVTLGEAMAVCSATQVGPLRHARTLQLGVAGSEFNVAVAVRRLGVPSAWIGRVGDDEFGALILRELRAEQVDDGMVTVDPDHPTGVMFKERRTSRGGSVRYYRAGSAGSRLAPEHLDADRIAGAAVLHVTGITPALGDGPRAAVERAIGAARRGGAVVSLDLNYRSRLWGREAATTVLTGLARRADIVFAGDDEAEMLVGEGPPERLAEGLAALGPKEAVIKLGARGSVTWAGGEPHRVKALEVAAIDPVGAGDAFVAGYLAMRIEGAPITERLDVARTAGAFAVTVLGDWEGAPTRAELRLLTGEDGTISR